MHNDKIKCFAAWLAIGFLNCNDQLQFNVFLLGECYWTSCNNCNGYNSSYIKLYMYATCATMLQVYHTTTTTRNLVLFNYSIFIYM